MRVWDESFLNWISWSWFWFFYLVLCLQAQIKVLLNQQLIPVKVSVGGGAYDLGLISYTSLLTRLASQSVAKQVKGRSYSSMLLTVRVAD